MAETFELVSGDSDLSVIVTPVRGVLVVGLANQTPVPLMEVQVAWFPPPGGEILTKPMPITIPSMGEMALLVGYACPSVGSWRLAALFRSGDGTESPLLVTRSFVAGDSVPGQWLLPETWHQLTPFLTSTEVPLPPGTAPAIAVQVVGREVAWHLEPLKGDPLALASTNPVSLVRWVPPGKIIISTAKGVAVPDAGSVANLIAGAGAVDHHRAYFDLGAGVSQLRLFLEVNWFVDETLNVVNRVHRVLSELHAPATLVDPLIPLLDKRETLKDLTATERQVFEQTLQKLEQVICPQ